MESLSISDTSVPYVMPPFRLLPNYGYTLWSTMVSLSAIFTLLERYSCAYPACNSKFTSLSMMQQHVREQHPPECLTCKKKFSRVTSLRNHYISSGHDGGVASKEVAGNTATRRVFSCKFEGCQKSFVTVSFS